MSTVKESDLRFVLEQIKKMRLAVYNAHIDPWATRQALWLAIEFDTEAAARKGITKEQLEVFDGLAIGQARQLAKSMPD